MGKITVVKCFIVQAPGRKAYNNIKFVFYTFSLLLSSLNGPKIHGFKKNSNIAT